MKAWHVGIAVGLAAIVLSQTAALAITVVVNGQVLPAYPPAVERSGRVLLPMRMVFEALQAEVRWEAATRTAIGIRGDTTVRMSINSRTAYINERAVTLDVPPQLIGGSTYMPVRFPAEAFGADVGWHGPTQTVSIALAGLPGAAAAQQPSAPQGGAPIVYYPRDGDRVGTRIEVSIKSTPGVLQVIWTEVYRTDTNEILKMVPGIRHLTKPDGTYQGGIAGPRISFGDDVPLRYEIHFRNGPNDGDPETIGDCYPED